jgi:hypothetical protein
LKALRVLLAIEILLLLVVIAPKLDGPIVIREVPPPSGQPGAEPLTEREERSAPSPPADATPADLQTPPPTPAAAHVIRVGSDGEPVGLVKVVIRAAPVASCALGGGGTRDLTWEAPQGRLYMEEGLNEAVKRQGGRCTVEFGSPTSFILDSVEGSIAVDGSPLGSGNGLHLRGSSLVIDYQPDDFSNGFDLFLEA